MLQTWNFNLWVGEITVNAKIKRFFQLFCSVKAKSLSFCVSLQLWPPHIPVCVQRSSSRAWKTRTWPFVSMRESAPSLKLWLEFTDTAGGSNRGVCILLPQHRSPLLFASPSWGWPLGRFHSGCFCLPSNLTVFCQLHRENYCSNVPEIEGRFMTTQTAKARDQIWLGCSWY